jgi:WD40 repeat protein
MIIDSMCGISTRWHLCSHTLNTWQQWRPLLGLHIITVFWCPEEERPIGAFAFGIHSPDSQCNASIQVHKFVSFFTEIKNLQPLNFRLFVGNLAWSKHSSELVSTHGYSQNQILVWKYPSLTQVAKLTGHSYRVLYLALSPDGEAIVTGAGDETLRFWNVFSKARSQKENKSVLNLYANIR